jgi:predicted short-subunit dehydrogenase-like oxidoreductase (DUF2520 family)
LSAQIKYIAFAGAGNVASHLSRAFYANGYLISGIYSPGQASASALASQVNSQVCKSIDELDRQADMVIISVPDHAFVEILDALGPSKKLIVHTSGGIDMELMKGKFEKYGVLYPLQTFSKNTETDLAKVPFCIEASDKEILEQLRLLASAVSGTVLDITSTQRRVLHLSAVFACNFPNSMYAIAADLLKDADLSFELLHPLILETARKAIIESPLKAQTGPARRNDKATMQLHADMLKKNEPFRQIYELISKTIEEQSVIDEV